MKAKLITCGMVVAGVLGFAVGAPAKTLQALLYAGSAPANASLAICNGTGVWAQASGFDNNGVLRCLTRQFSNNNWTTYNLCDALTTKQNASLRTTGVSFCASPLSAWGAPGAAAGQVCSVNNMILKVNGGACVNQGTVFSFSNSF